jgi:pyruvate dehydrogenase E2 component (dihydrolipoamide acetyltransferase)
LKSPDAVSVTPVAVVAATPAVPQVVESAVSNASHAHTSQLSPAARHIVTSKSLDVSGIKGTAKGGRISKEDVVNLLNNGGKVSATSTSTSHSAAAAAPAVSKVAAAPTPQPAPTKTPASSSSDNESDYTDINNSNVRKVIAKRLTQSKQTVPHSYTTAECDITNLLELRKELKSKFNVAVSVNDVVIKAAALALRDNPVANAKWDLSTSQVVSNKGIDISVAVATPNGLITPILFGADNLGLNSINSKVKDLAGRAKDNKLKPEEFSGGSFTISNLVSLFTYKSCITILLEMTVLL